LKRFLKSEAGAAVLWVLTALLVAAIAAPWAYHWGNRLARVAASQEMSAFSEWLGRACGRSKFERYFSRCFSISAVLMLPILLMRIRSLRASSGVPVAPRVRVPWKSAVLQVAVGCLIAGGLLLATGMILNLSGAYTLEPHPPKFGALLQRSFIPAIGASVLEEWVFRGLILGLWLRFTRPLAACVGTSVFFAFLHFLAPKQGSFIGRPRSPAAGFELLEKILAQFANPQFFMTEFVTLFCIGMILAWARLRTGALWFSIGLHAGWIAAFKGFSMLHLTNPASGLYPWGVGDSLKSGLVPLLALAVTAGICHFVLKRFEPSRGLNPASR
jgi:membrane protease YdiL (CAAX protease family)